MSRFNAKVGMVVLLVLAATQMVVSLSLGHSARGESPVDLSVHPLQHALDAWRAAALLVEKGEQVAVIDTRPKASFELFHLPGAINLPDAKADQIKRAADGVKEVLLVTPDDGVAPRLIEEAVPGMVGTSLHYLSGGIRAWYLNLALPVPLFNDRPAPHGYAEALHAVNAYLDHPGPGRKRAAALEAVGTLARLDYQPTELQRGGPPKPSGTKRKKIVGGCG